MDGEQVVARSLQKELTFWVSISTILVSLVAGLISGILAYNEAKEIQDDLLLQASRIVADNRSALPTDISDVDEDFRILVLPLRLIDDDRLIADLRYKNGFSTIEFRDERWRIYVPGTAHKVGFAVAQRTELRDQLAWSSVFSALIPIGVLSVILLVTIRWIIFTRIKPIVRLSKDVDQLSVNSIELLPIENIPIEVKPFTDAINRLLLRTRSTIELQRRFIADASHELRTPLAALLLLSDNFKSAKSDLERKECALLMASGLHRLSRLVDQLLNLARLQNVKAESFLPVPMNDIVKEAVTELYPLAEQKLIDLGVSNIIAAKVLDANGGVRKLVDNAISNAINYTLERGRIDVSLSQSNGNVVFVVSDTGPGIVEDELDSVFIPFFRSKNTTPPGSGLGLAICAEIAEHLGGEIKLTNREQGGLLFTYTQKAVM